MMKRSWMALCLILTTIASGFAEEGEVAKIQDNSFLIEEGYNQEPGVIQHIQSLIYMKDSTWGYAFTQEWPVPKQTHQLSYTIPVLHVKSSGEETGLGDVALNYRYQLLLRGPLAIAPRLSLLLPTGDRKKGQGSGSVGLQTNLPLSVELLDRWVTHWNMGLTWTPDHKGPGRGEADTLDFNLGASLIFLASENINLMCEGVWTSIESIREDGRKKRDYTFLINPGMRFAINFKSGLQIVPGMAIPLGLGPSSGEYGMFLYLSFEHPLWQER